MTCIVVPAVTYLKDFQLGEVLLFLLPCVSAYHCIGGVLVVNEYGATSLVYFIKCDNTNRYMVEKLFQINKYMGAPHKFLAKKPTKNAKTLSHIYSYIAFNAVV